MSSNTEIKKTDEGNWHQSVWKVVSDIPSGHVLTYGEVARLSGMPKAARRVSQALRRAPKNLNVPWHRVITASGRIAFTAGSDAFREQSRRLQAEDVPILKGRVDMRKYRWQPDLDELLWKPGPAWDETE